MKIFYNKKVKINLFIAFIFLTCNLKNDKDKDIINEENLIVNNKKNKNGLNVIPKNQKLVIILFQGIKFLKNSDYINQLKNNLSKKFPNAYFKIIVEEKSSINEPINNQSQEIFDTLKSDINIKTDDKIILIGHSKGANKAIILQYLLEKSNYKNAFVITIGGVLKGTDITNNIEARLELLKTNEIVKKFLKSFINKIKINGEELNLSKNIKDLLNQEEILIQYFFKHLEATFKSYEGENFKELKKDSNHIKFLNNYLTKTNNKLLLIGSKITFFDYIKNFLSKNINIEDLKEEFEKKINQLYNEIVVYNTKEKFNDLILTLDTQLINYITNTNIKRKLVEEDVSHFDQCNNEKINNIIVNYIQNIS